MSDGRASADNPISTRSEVAARRMKPLIVFHVDASLIELNMQIVLISPPPWKIAEQGEVPLPPEEGGPPRGRESMVLGGDFLGPPYGLLLIAAQAIRAGHDVTTINLSNFAWPEVLAVIERLKATLFGLTCFTANRRGTALVAEAIRNHHPGAHIVVGGPHASALPREMLEGHEAIDSVVIGAGEESFLELCHRLEIGEPPGGIAGTAWRDDDGLHINNALSPSRNLDHLAPLHEIFETPFILTSRGCTGRCTFCGSRAMWGKGIRFHSVEYVLDSLETIVVRHGQHLVAIKDDTFTARRSRTLEICRGIETRGLELLWTCDTRADAIASGGEELVEAMRRAGCVQVSLGVESGSSVILERLRKRLELDQVRRATQLARSVGIRVRYYLILGSPGETLETLEATFAFIRSERPHHVVFTPFSTYPGTAEYDMQASAGRLRADVFFEEDFWTPTFFKEMGSPTKEQVIRLIGELPGIGLVCRPTLSECRIAVEKLPQVAANHMDLSGALFDAGELDESEAAVRRAVELGYPLAGIGDNYLACIAARRGDIQSLQRHIEAASKGYPLRHVQGNIERFQAWEQQEGSDLSTLDLEPHPRFEIAEAMVQPLNPGPIEVRA